MNITALASDRQLAIRETREQLTTTGLDSAAAMAVLVRRARELTDAAGSVIELVEGGEVVPHVASGAGRAHLAADPPLAASLSRPCAEHGEVLHCRDANYDPRVDSDSCRQVGAISVLCVPLRRAERVVGVLEVFDPRPRAFDETDVETLRMLSGLAAVHVGDPARLAA